jgi:hypothetical protein
VIARLGAHRIEARREGDTIALCPLAGVGTPEFLDQGCRVRESLGLHGLARAVACAPQCLLIDALTLDACPTADLREGNPTMAWARRRPQRSERNVVRHSSR